MTWQKIVIVILLLYIFALLQNSFFAHFSLFGATPNLVFSFFFLLVFFSEKENYIVIFLAILAGFFLDVFSYSYLGLSIIILIIIGLLLKKVQSELKVRHDNHPISYFLPLFIISLLIYDALMSLWLRFSVFSIIYSAIFGTAFFYIYKRWQKFIQ